MRCVQSESGPVHGRSGPSVRQTMCEVTLQGAPPKPSWGCLEVARIGRVADVVQAQDSEDHGLSRLVLPHEMLVPALPSLVMDPLWDQFAALLPERTVVHPLGCHPPRIGPNRVRQARRACRHNEHLQILNNQPVTSSGEEKETAAKDSSRQGVSLSEVVGRILEQLSVSAWLPATTLVGALAVCLEFRSQGSLSLPSAMGALSRNAGGTLVLLVAAIIIITVVTQAFEFETIRFLEGYWGGGPIWTRLTAARVRHYRSQLKGLRDACKAAERQAFRSAAKRLRKTGIPAQDIEILRLLTKKGSAPGFADDDVARARRTKWQSVADPTLLRHWEALRRRTAEFPKEHRLLPTRLGNTLRAYEDRVVLSDGGDLQGFVMRNYASISNRLLNQYVDFRTRLDMYCSLTLVFPVLALISGALLWGLGPAAPLTTVAATVGFASLSAVSYSAAVASARGLGSVLVAIGTEVADRRKSGSTSSQAS